MNENKIFVKKIIISIVLLSILLLLGTDYYLRYFHIRDINREDEYIGIYKENRTSFLEIKDFISTKYKTDFVPKFESDEKVLITISISMEKITEKNISIYIGIRKFSDSEIKNVGFIEEIVSYNSHMFTCFSNIKNSGINRIEIYGDLSDVSSIWFTPGGIIENGRSVGYSINWYREKEDAHYTKSNIEENWFYFEQVY